MSIKYDLSAGTVEQKLLETGRHLFTGPVEHILGDMSKLITTWIELFIDNESECTALGALYADGTFRKKVGFDKLRLEFKNDHYELIGTRDITPEEEYCLKNAEEHKNQLEKEQRRKTFFELLPEFRSEICQYNTI